jgi:TonB family protein
MPTLMPIERKSPRYPTKAMRARVEGRVIASFSLSAAGEVSDPRIECSIPQGVFDKTTLESVSAWRYPAPGNEVTRRRIYRKLMFALPN